MGALVGLLIAAPPARAQGPDANAAAAEALFLEAKGLLRDGDAAGACPKLAESQRLDPGTGTLLMLALCHERTGRTASASSEYREALARALREERADREELARRHIASLERHLAHVRVVVPDEDAALSGFEVRTDGAPLMSTAGTVTIPVDPGSHLFEAFAKGERLWSVTVVVANEAEHEVLVPRLGVTVPAPQDAQAATAPPKVAPAAESSHPLRYAAYGASAVALAGVVIGTVFGQFAIEQSKEAKRLCPAYPCAAGAATANEAAKSAATVSNISFAAGGVGALGALSFALLDGSSRASTGASSPAPSRVAGFTLGWQGQW